MTQVTELQVIMHHGAVLVYSKPGESFSVTFNNTGTFEYHGQPGPRLINF